MANELRSDIQAAKDRTRAKLGAGREITKLPEQLWEGETVERMTTGAYGKGARPHVWRHGPARCFPARWCRHHLPPPPHARILAP